MKNALVILAGGKGKRFGQKIPKQFLKIGNTNFLNYLFHSENIYTKLFRNRGLRLVNKIPVIKNLLIKNAVGKIKI